MPTEHAFHFTFNQGHFGYFQSLHILSQCLQKEGLESIRFGVVWMYLQQFICIFEAFLIVFGVVELLNVYSYTASCLYACPSLGGNDSAPWFIIKSWIRYNTKKVKTQHSNLSLEKILFRFRLMLNFFLLVLKDDFHCLGLLFLQVLKFSTNLGTCLAHHFRYNRKIATIYR